jgi:integrase
MAKRRSKGEGSIFFLDEKKLWAAAITLPDGKKRRKYSKNQKDVREWLIKQRKAAQDGLLVDDRKLTVGEFIDRWFNDVKYPNLRPATRITVESIIRNHIKPELGDIRLKELTPIHIQNLYTQKLNDGLSTRTVKYIHTILHQSIDQALKWGFLARNATDAVETPKSKRKKVKPLTEEQVSMLFEVIKDDRLFPLYVVLLGCGLRRGEALALKLDDIDLDKGEIQVRKTLQHLHGIGFVVGEPKSERSRRTVAIPDYAKEVLSQHLANREVESDYVFCTSNGTPFIPRHIVRHFKAQLKKAGLPKNIRIHDLRHTFVSYLLAQNTPPKDVQEIVGHASFSTTMDIYGHLMPNAHRDAAKKMDRFFEDIEGVP